MGLAGCATSSQSSESSSSKVETDVTLHVSSTLYGTADTGNKSSLKKTLQKTSGPGDIDIYHYDDSGNRVAYPEGTVVAGDAVSFIGEAIFDLGDNLDDSKINSKSAIVSVAPGDGYGVDEITLTTTKVDGDWYGGKYYYTLTENDINWYTGDYEITDDNSTREWSCFGGDGNGCYTFNLQVSGITYDGAEVPAVIFPVQVYIWGRDATDRGVAFDSTPTPTAAQSSSGVAQTSDVQWTWKGDGDLPILCGSNANDFFITWPTGTDASYVAQDNVSVTLHSQYGDSYKLKSSEYTVFPSVSETQVAVTFMNWPYTPVYTTMSIDAAESDLEASETFEIASVYAYMVQTGGGGVTVDGTVTAYSYYGFSNLTSVDQIMNNATYTLGITKDEVQQYFVESSDGEGTLSSNAGDATAYDASGEGECNQQLIGTTAWATTRVDQTEDKTVDGETVTLTKTYSTRGINKSIDEAKEAGLKPAAGFAFGEKMTPYELWPWQTRFLAGYTPSRPAPTSFPYVDFPYGY